MERSGRTILIAGGIGTGKSVVSMILRLKGFRVYDCDANAGMIMTQDAGVREVVSEVCGQKAYTPEGELCRPVVASVIFSDEEARNRVNAAVHAAVKLDILGLREYLDEPLFVESAIPATSGLTEICDEAWLVEAPEEIRVERVCRRNGMKPEQVLQRMQTQARETELLESAPIAIKRITNDGETPLLPQIEELISEIE